MAQIKRVRCPLTGGGVVGPSVSTFYFTSSATGFPAKLQTFFQAIKAAFPNDVTITVPNTGDVINDTDGTLAGIWTDSGGGVTVGTSTSSFALGAGQRVNWLTAGTRGGRRVVGTTFLVPLTADAFDTFGSCSTAQVALVQAAASALVSAVAPDMLIWGKPHSRLAADGESNPVIASIARSIPTGLRSRRT